MTDELSWLQQWFATQCDGAWEHGFGITIETLDNPGWSVKICVEGTALESARFDLVKSETSETDWILCRIVERQQGPLPPSWQNYRRFEGFGGVRNLPDILRTFRTWAEVRR
jgi:Immunity protein 53